VLVALVNQDDASLPGQMVAGLDIMPNALFED
jgi:hypothetical protein